MKIFNKILFIPFLATSIFSLDVDILFYVQDAGETNYLADVFEDLSKMNKNFLIISEGTSKKILNKGPYVKSFEELGLEVSIDKREDKISSDVIEQIQKEIHPKLFVSSVAYLAAAQLIQAFKDNSIETISIWDNFNATGQDPYFSTAFQVVQNADIVIFPSQNVAQDKIFKSCSFIKVIGGQPAVEKWVEQINLVKTKQIKQKLSLDSDQKILTYIGGTGLLYEEGFKLFLNCLKSTDLKNYQVIIARHPKMVKRFEKREIRKLINHNPNISFPKIDVIEDDDISTIDAAAVADLVVCHQSTAGFFAIAAGKNVVFLVPPKQKFSNLAIENKLAIKASNQKEFISAIKDKKIENKDFFQTLQIPKNSKYNIISILLARLAIKGN